MKTLFKLIVLSVSLFMLSSKCNNDGILPPKGLITYENCVNRCDESYDQAQTSYNLCMEEYYSQYRTEIQNCPRGNAEVFTRCHEGILRSLASKKQSCEKILEDAKKARSECKRVCRNLGEVQVK